MSIISKFSTWANQAPVEGRIIGSTAVTTVPDFETGQ